MPVDTLELTKKKIDSLQVGLGRCVKLAEEINESLKALKQEEEKNK